MSTIIGGPNRDPARYADPERFDITRDPNAWSFTFGMGPHSCLGHALAPAELQESAAAMARHTRDLELTEEPVWQPRVMADKVDRCPIRFRDVSRGRAKWSARSVGVRGRASRSSTPG